MSEKLETNLEFQKSILKMALTNDGFATQFCKYLKDDVNSKEFMVFSDYRLTYLFNVINDSIKKYSVAPTRAQVLDRMSEHDEDAPKFIEAYEAVMSVDVKDSEYFKEKIKNFILITKVRAANNAVFNTFKANQVATPDLWQSWANEMARVSLDPDSRLTLEDVPRLMAEIRSAKSAPITTGIKELDDALLGGFPRGALVSILSVQNAGKSLAALGFGANALRAKGPDGKDLGLKVLHIPLEGTEVEAPFRYTANLADIDSRVLRQGDMNAEQKQKFESAMKMYGSDRLIVYPKLKFGTTVEEIIRVMREVSKTFKFDVVIVDYGRLLTVENAKGLQSREILEKVHQGLSQVAKEFNCVMISPVQANRDALKQRNDKDNNGGKGMVITSDMIGEAYAISHVSEIILSINATKEEMKTGRLRLYLEKQRHEANNLTFGLKTNFKHSNLITGETYDASSDVIINDKAINLGEAQAAVPKGEITNPGDQQTMLLNQGIDRMRTRKKLLLEVKDHEAKAKTAAQAKTREQHEKEIPKIMARVKVMESQAIDFAHRVYGWKGKIVEPSLSDQLKDMKRPGATFAPEKIENAELGLEMLRLLIANPPKAKPQ